MTPRFAIALVFALLPIASGATSAVAAETEGAAAHGADAAHVVPDSEDTPAVPPLWPDTPVVEPDKQPFVLMRKLRAVQDQVAAGSSKAHEEQRRLMNAYGTELAAMPAAVWDDVRNVRAAVFFGLSGGNPALLRTVAERQKTPHIERRLVKGALAYGEGRKVDALAMLHKVDARKIDPSLGGIVALIQGTLVGRKDTKKAILHFDEARLLAPGTLIEEAALRQQIMLVAREGEVDRFDLLAEQYSRRFPRSLFARGFRRQFFAGVARQHFKPTSEWVSRTESELMKLPASERVGMYLAIAQEATRGGNIDIARFAAAKARDLSRPGSRQMTRATLYEGAALAVTDEFDKGVAMLGDIDSTTLTEADRELRDAALSVATSVGKWPAAAEELEDDPSPAVKQAKDVLAEVDTLLGGSE